MPDQISSSSNYRGRFAPSPTGPLHFGSLVAALGSFLDAKHHNGHWLIRMEDLDTPRCIKGAADDILLTLDAFGLHSDETIIYQSQRTEAYHHALEELKNRELAYPCCCTRREIADSAIQGIDGPVYPGTCRNGLPDDRIGRAWRIRTDNTPIILNDALQGSIRQSLEDDVGDFVLKRADGLFAYQLAVVVDDATQEINNVVRGADLLDSTPRQIYLQRLLNIATPAYMHLPVVVNNQGEKLSKQTLAQAVARDNAHSTLFAALQFLKQSPPETLRNISVQQQLTWAIANWNPDRLWHCRQLTQT